MKRLLKISNAVLAKNGLSLATLEDDIADACIFDNEMRLRDIKSSEGIKKFSAITRSWREIVKKTAVSSALSSMHGGQPFFMAEFGNLIETHNRFNQALSTIRSEILSWDQLDTEVPLWRVWDYLGKDVNDDPEFKITDIDNSEDFRRLVVESVKFKKDLAQWIYDDLCQDYTLPVLDLHTDIGLEIISRLEKFAVDKTIRNKKEGRESWDYMEFYTSGSKYGELTDNPNILGLLSFVGRVSSTYNNMVRNINFLIGKGLYGNTGVAGMEQRDPDPLEILGYVITFSSSNNEGMYVVDDDQMRALQSELEEASAEIMVYQNAYESLLPSLVLERMDLFYHCGTDRYEVEGEIKYVPRPFMHREFEPELSIESYQIDIETRRKKAIEGDIKRLKAFKAGDKVRDKKMALATHAKGPETESNIYDSETSEQSHYRELVMKAFLARKAK